MIIEAQRDESHQSNCNRLNSVVNAVTSYLVEKEMFALQVMRQITGGEAIQATEYTCFGRVTEFQYGAELGNAFRGNNPIKYLRSFGMVESYYKFPVGVKFFIQTLKIDKQRRMSKYFK